MTFLTSMALAGAAHAASGQPELVYLNFSDGTETITFAPVDDATTNRSSLGAASPYPAFAWPTIGTGIETRSQVIARIAHRVNDLFLPYNVLFTLRRPETGPFTTVMIGGSPRDIGITENLGGVAYMDCGNQEASNLVFAFPGNLRGSEHGLVVTIAQEAAHAFGLEHTESRRDLMHPELSPEQASFTDEDNAILDERLCGNGTQNSHRKLLEMVGPWLGDTKPLDDGTRLDREAPTLTLVAPALGATVAQPFALELLVEDAGGIDHVTLTITSEQPGAGPEQAVLRHPPFAFSLGGLPAGRLAYTVTAYDRSGNPTTVTGALSLLADPGLERGVPACRAAPGGSSSVPPASPAGLLTAAMLGMVWAGFWRRRGRLARRGGGAVQGPHLHQPHASSINTRSKTSRVTRGY